jgi:hypothetical protein
MKHRGVTLTASIVVYQVVSLGDNTMTQVKPGLFNGLLSQ